MSSSFTWNRFRDHQWIVRCIPEIIDREGYVQFAEYFRSDKEVNKMEGLRFERGKRNLRGNYNIKVVEESADGGPEGNTWKAFEAVAVRQRDENGQRLCVVGDIVAISKFSRERPLLKGESNRWIVLHVKNSVELLESFGNLLSMKKQTMVLRNIANGRVYYTTVDDDVYPLDYSYI